MPRKAHQYHYIYKTTNTITSKYYIGMHSTSTIDDGYLGSGKRLRYSINKYGKENHIKEIIEYCKDKEELAKREKEIVNEALLKEDDCINLKVGGEGGLVNKDHGIKLGASAKIRNKWLWANDKNYRDNLYNHCKERFIKYWKDGKFIGRGGNKNGFYGKSHKEETKISIGESNKISQLGNKNSQFGTVWITNGIENKKINKNDLIPDDWKLGRKMI